jgi:hypothetical protein
MDLHRISHDESRSPAEGGTELSDRMRIPPNSKWFAPCCVCTELANTKGTNGAEAGTI